MPRRTKEDAEKTRQALMKTALQLFFEKGITATTLNDIAKSAGVTKGAFYWHFKNKLELIQAIEQDHTDQYRQMDQLLVSEEGDPIQNLLKAAELYFDQVETIPELRQFLYVGYFMCEYTEEHESIKAWDKSMYQHYIVLICELLDRVPEDQWLPGTQANSEQLANVLVDSINGFLLRCLLLEESDLAARATAMMRIILTGGGIKNLS